MRLFGNRISKPSSRWVFWRWYDIVLDGLLYLTRLNVWKTPWGSIKLHWIHQPDPDRDLHDHPWWFVSFVIWGGYEEHESRDPANEPGRVRRIRWFNYKSSKTAHRISSVKPRTLTLIISGPKNYKKEWGFYDAETLKFTHWQEYEEAKANAQRV